jgi:hypothetical protein
MIKKNTRLQNQYKKKKELNSLDLRTKSTIQTYEHVHGPYKV